MSLRIGCDLDGVLADMESELIRQAKVLFGDIALRPNRDPAPLSPPSPSLTTSPPQKNAPRLAALDMSDRQQRQLWRHVESIDGFWETLKEIESGIVARLAALAAERRWELIFLTKRPESAGATAQVQTQRWLQAKGFTLPSVFVVQGSRGRVAHAFNLDFFIDDRPENCLDIVLDSTTRALLVWREDEKLLPVTVRRPGVQVVSSMSECLDMLEQADGATRERPGLIGWLKKQFGLSDG